MFETVIATGVLITALAGVAQLLVLGAQLTRQANVSGMALSAAQSKLEELRARTFAFNEAGAAVTDAALEPSAANSLDEDVDPYCDWLDDRGQPQDDADGAAFVRRWRISPVVDALPDAIAIEVCVFAGPERAAAAPSADACLSTIRTRQP